jgi:hypothetical protein
MSRITSLKPTEGIESKWSLEDNLGSLTDSRSTKLCRQMQAIVSHDRSSICVPHYVWSTFGGVISIFFPHVTSCLSPVLEGGPR